MSMPSIKKVLKIIANKNLKVIIIMLIITGRTPLHLAVNSREGGTDVHFDVEDHLLRSGAKTDIRDIRGRIALHYAFVKIGRHKDHSFLDPIELVALLNPSDSTTIQQPSADVADNFGSTPLHYAAQRGATISCMHLLKAVNINPVDNNDNTPLGLAVLYKHEGMLHCYSFTNYICDDIRVTLQTSYEFFYFDIYSYSDTLCRNLFIDLIPE